MVTRRPKTIHFWRGDLPHWQVENGRYFVTIRLYGALPPKANQRIRDLCDQYKKVEGQFTADKGDAYLKLSRRIFAAMEGWLDCTPTVKHFEKKELCEMVTEAIEHRQRLKVWDMFSYVIMPSHLHLFFDFNDDLSLKRELEEFKRWTGHQAAKLVQQLSGKRFWQSEWFDHWSRSDEGDEKIVRYIQNNPVKARIAPAIGDFRYWK